MNFQEKLCTALCLINLPASTNSNQSNSFCRFEKLLVPYEMFQWYVLVLFLVLANARKPAIYIDNGMDQTTASDMTNREQIEVESELLNLLGLPKRPRRKKSALNMSAPRYLLDVYNTIMQEEEEEESNRVKRDVDESELTPGNLTQISESDIIITFDSIDGVQSNSLRHTHGKELWFKPADTLQVDDTIGAVLRVYKQQVYGPGSAFYTIQLSRISIVGDEEVLEPIVALNTTTGYSGWLEFDLTSNIRFLLSSNEKYGLYLTGTASGMPGKDLKLDGVGVVTSKANDETKPFIVAFLKAENRVNVSVRKRREAKSKEKNFGDLIKSLEKTTSDSSETSSLCRTHVLYISFKDLKWHDFIIAPEGYSSFYCAGQCEFPFHGHVNATNHAIVQTLVRLIHPKRYSKPCCAPVLLKPISVLYFLDDFNVILKKYKNMVVKKCGCR